LLGYRPVPLKIYTKNRRRFYTNMKSKYSLVLKFIANNLFFLWCFGVFVLLIYSISASNAQHKTTIKMKDQEIADLRSKINNHLVAEGFFNKPAKDVLPVMKDFGIGL
jgi:hypothetical protein